MGHDIFFIDSMKNQHTWTPLKAKHIKVSPQSNKGIPDADFIIATGYKSVGPTIAAPKRCGEKVHWIRAWEHWQMPDHQIVKRILKAHTIKLVNSICLQDKLMSHGFVSHIIRPGYDLEEMFPKHIRDEKKEIVLGGLYREGVHGRRKRTTWLFEAVRSMKTKHKDIQFWLFGSEKNPKRGLVDKYVRSPSIAEKNNFYNGVDIWMAPTMSEGLHLPPAEAMLTECPVVTTNAELSGTQDYTNDYDTGIVSLNNLNSFIECVNLLIGNKKLRKKLGVNGRNKILEIGDRKKNMQIMVDLFMERIS
jgi:glycosyltransferase involved in cell wall biosynthesis